MTLAACFKKPVALQVLEKADDELLAEIAQDRAMKVRERLAKKIVEKKKNFQFNFSVTEAPEEDAEEEKAGPPRGKADKKTKKKQRHRDKKKAAAREDSSVALTSRLSEGPTVLEASEVPAAAAAPGVSTEELRVQSQPALDDKPSHAAEPQPVSPPPLSADPQPRIITAPPPGFEDVVPTPPVPAISAPASASKAPQVQEEAEVGLSLEERLRIARAQSEKKARKDKKKKRKGKQGSVAVAAYRQAQQDEGPKRQTAEPVQFCSWKDQAISEEERAKRRFGQGTRNLTAIAVRKSQTDRAKVVGVIGGEAKEPQAGQEAAVKEMTTAFSFGFSL